MDSSRSKSGLTLVELLVALTILAGLATMVAVSTVGAQDRENVARTIRQGTALRNALTASEGLSFSSDFGRVPASLSELKALLTREIPAQVQVEANGEILTSTETKRLPLYTELTSPLVPTNQMDGLTTEVRTRAQAVATRVGGQLTLGAGWRGPYVTERFKLSDGAVLDPFGGAWNYGVTNQLATLTSLGRDRAADADSSTADWPDADRSFEATVSASTLVLNATCPDAEETLSLHVFDVTPRLTIPTRVGAAPTIILAGRYACATNGLSLRLEGLAPGLHAFFIYAQNAAGTATWTQAPVTELVGTGNHALSLTLLRN